MACQTIFQDPPLNPSSQIVSQVILVTVNCLTRGMQGGLEKWSVAPGKDKGDRPKQWQINPFGAEFA